MEQTLNSVLQSQDPGMARLVRERFCHAIPRVYFPVSSLCFRRLNDPSVVTPFSRDDRGHTPLHVAALCGMWSWAGLCGFESKKIEPQGWPSRGLAGRGAVELGRLKGLRRRPTPGGLAAREEAEAPQALLGCSAAPGWKSAQQCSRCGL